LCDHWRCDTPVGMFMSVGEAAAAVAGMRAERNGLLGPVRQELRAWPWWCDVLGHVNNARYLDLAHLGRVAWLARQGLLRSALRHGQSFVMAGATITYRREIARMARFALETQVVGWDDRWLCFSSIFLLHDGDQQRVAARAILRGQVRARGRAVDPLELIRRGGMEPPPAFSPAADVDAALRAQDAILADIRAREGRS
jgi:acyl-CoA thioesterase FadM